MRLHLILAIGVSAVLASCGGKAAPRLPPAPASAAQYPATRWIPAKPTYALAARTVRDAQRSIRDALDVFGPMIEADAATVSAGLRNVLRVDPLSVDELAAIGIDIDGGIVAFSESLDPTMVVRLASPAQFQAFLAEQGEVPKKSVVVEGVEVFTTQVFADIHLSWAIADGWLWLHLATGLSPDDGTAWFSSSRAPGAPAWTGDWQWAQQRGGAGQPPAVAGFADLRGLLAMASARVPGAVACARLLEPVGRVAIAIDGDQQHASGKLAFDLGASAAAVETAVMPAPEGWPTVAARAPVSVQWNLDLAATRAWLEPCAQTFNVDLGELERYGIRAGRALLVSYDADDNSGTGAVALDLAHKKYFASLLDQIPLRSTLERKRSFGPHAGRTLSIPFGPSVDYVLADSLALAGMGDGLLAAVVGGGATTPGPVFALDLAPTGLTRESWHGLLRLVGIRDHEQITNQLLRWQDAHFSVTLDGTRLVFAAMGNRR